jgi:hypothetical protein
MKLNDFIQRERNITDDFESSRDTHENYGKQGNFKLGIDICAHFRSMKKSSS